MRGQLKAAATLALSQHVCDELAKEFQGKRLHTWASTTSLLTESVISMLEEVSDKERERIDGIIDEMNKNGLIDQESWQIYLSMAIGCITDRVVEIQGAKPDSPIAAKIESLMPLYQKLHTHFASRTRKPEWDAEGTRLYQEWEKRVC